MATERPARRLIVALLLAAGCARLDAALPLALLGRQIVRSIVESLVADAIRALLRALLGSCDGALASASLTNVELGVVDARRVKVGTCRDQQLWSTKRAFDADTRTAALGRKLAPKALKSCRSVATVVAVRANDR